MPEPSGEAIKSVREFLDRLESWHGEEPSDQKQGYFWPMWYRGVNTHFEMQMPKIYREKFSARASNLERGGDLEDDRRQLECEMFMQFRSAGAALLQSDDMVDMYFAAQHFGMPTRLLDWSTNPLAALFFACRDQSPTDGVVYAMNAREVIPGDATFDGKRLPQAVMTMRHDLVLDAVAVSYWATPDPEQCNYILPVRPDVVPGRIGAQGSCFTLHMHRSGDAAPKKTVSIRVETASKRPILEQLHRLGVNQFTVFEDLDHLSKGVTRSWGLADLCG